MYMSNVADRGTDMPCNVRVEVPINVRTKMTDPGLLAEAMGELGLKFTRGKDYFTILSGRYKGIKGGRFMEEVKLVKQSDGKYILNGRQEDIDALLTKLQESYARAAIKRELGGWGGELLEDGDEMVMRVGGRNKGQTVRVTVDGDLVTGVVEGSDLDICNPLVHGINHRLGKEQADHAHDWDTQEKEQQQFVGGEALGGQDDVSEDPFAGEW